MVKQKGIVRPICAAALAFTVIFSTYAADIKAETIVSDDRSAEQQMTVIAEVTTPVSDGIAPQGLGSPDGEVIGNGVRMRSGPGTSYTIKELLYYGETVSINWTVTYSHSDGTWYYVMRTKTGTWGWVKEDYILPWY